VQIALFLSLSTLLLQVVPVEADWRFLLKSISFFIRDNWIQTNFMLKHLVVKRFRLKSLERLASSQVLRTHTGGIETPQPGRELECRYQGADELVASLAAHGSGPQGTSGPAKLVVVIDNGGTCAG
jgi:hypothetical protein